MAGGSGILTFHRTFLVPLFFNAHSSLGISVAFENIYVDRACRPYWNHVLIIEISSFSRQTEQ